MSIWGREDSPATWRNREVARKGGGVGEVGRGKLCSLL